MTGPTRDTSTSSALRSPVVATPRISRRPLTLTDNFEDLFSRREPAASTSAVASSTETTVDQPILNHDHSYTSSATNAILAAISAARARAATSATATSSTQQAGSSSTENSSALTSRIERLHEQTRRLYAATNAAADANRSGTGHLSQALALLAPPSASGL